MTLHFVPAGAYPSYTGGVLLYYRKLPESQHDFSRAPYSPTGWMQKEEAAKVWAGDREFLICCAPQKWRPTIEDGTWDGCLNTSFYQKDGLGERYLDYTLIAAHNGIKLNIRNKDFKNSEKIKIMGDSGGAQIKLGVAAYVDPHEVIAWMNQVCDYGFTLDICPRPVDCMYDDVVDGCAEIQLRHNKLFLEKRAENLKLINVMHGHTYDQQRAWYKKVNIPGFCAWGCGADSWLSHLSTIRGFMIPMMPAIKAKKKGEPMPPDSEFYHLFGTSGRVMVPGLSWLGRYVPNITMDSTSWLMSVKTRTMEVITPTGALRAIPVGQQGMGLGPYHPLACSCEICSIVGYGSVFNLDARLRVIGLLATHNWITYARFIKLWGKVAEELPYKQFLELLESKFGKASKTAKQPEKLPVLYAKYAECVVNNGFKAAEAEFKPYLQVESGKAMMDSDDNLWGTEELHDFTEEQDETIDRVTEASGKTEAYYQGIISKRPQEYYSFSTQAEGKLVGGGVLGESAAAFCFPFYFKREELEAMDLSVHDRMHSLHYVPGLRPKPLKNSTDYLKIVKSRRDVWNKVKKGIPVEGAGPWLDAMVAAEKELYDKLIRKVKPKPKKPGEVTAEQAKEEELLIKELEEVLGEQFVAEDVGENTLDESDDEVLGLTEDVEVDDAILADVIPVDEIEDDEEEE